MVKPIGEHLLQSLSEIDSRARGELDPSNGFLNGEGTESPAEERFVLLLRKFFRDYQVLQQVQLGPYRVDFLIDDFAIEIDGKHFHNHEKDQIGDQWILDHTQVRALARIPAGALHFLPMATAAVLGSFIPEMAKAITCCPPAKTYSKTIDSIDFLAGQETFRVESYPRCHVCQVGSALSFLAESPEDSKIAGKVWTILVFEKSLS